MNKSELQEWENKCIQEEPPECSAACPIHVDGRLFVKEMGRGDIEAAYKVLAKNMPFPGILGRVCDHPCELKCKRGEIEAPIAIGLLERRCVENATSKARFSVLQRRQQRIAVLGGGFAGLCAGWDLLKKGYGVTFFVPGDSLGGSLLEYPESLLPAGVIAEEISILEGLKAEFRFNSQLDSEVFEGICSEFDALFVDREGVAGCAIPLGCDQGGEIIADAATGATDREGVFAGGGTRARGAYSPVGEALHGRKGALSIERSLQKVQLGTGRENEGPFQTRLFTNVEQVSPVPRVVPADGAKGYDAGEARAEAGRCIQCECMECVKVCLYLERFDGYPKKYTRQIFNNEYVMHGRARTKNQFVNSCSACGLCETVCPSNFYMGDLCLQARRTMVETRVMPPSFHEFALNDMAHSGGEEFALCRNEPGKAKSAWLYFPSCQLCATSPTEVLSSYKHLRGTLSGGVGIMLGCCGAPAHWAGREELFRPALENVRVEWERLGKPRMVTACSTCQSLFGEHLPEIESIPLWQLLEKHGLPEGVAGSCSGKTVSVADPCITRHDAQTQESVRSIAGKLGMAIDELPLSGKKPECCGFGGLMFNANPGLARDVLGHRVNEQAGSGSAASAKPYQAPAGLFRNKRIEGRDTVYYMTEVSGHDYLAYCAMCRDNLAASGKRTSHLIEHVFPCVAGGDPAARGWISWSERRLNRARVKAGILEEFGEKGAASVEEYRKIVLHLAPEVARRIDERRILEDDLRKVIDYAEKSGKRLQNRTSGLFRAYHQDGNVTFWLDYSPEQGGYRVHNAYCHRMKIVGID